MTSRLSSSEILPCSLQLCLKTRVDNLYTNDAPLLAIFDLSLARLACNKFQVPYGTSITPGLNNQAISMMGKTWPTGDLSTVTISTMIGLPW